MTCQANPALLKRVQQSVRIFQFLVVYHKVNGLEDPWPVSRHCPEPRWFVGDPTSLARDNINPDYNSSSIYVFRSKSPESKSGDSIMTVSLMTLEFSVSKVLKVNIVNI